jgi:hypothetical protein
VHPEIVRLAVVYDGWPSNARRERSMIRTKGIGAALH